MVWPFIIVWKGFGLTTNLAVCIIPFLCGFLAGWSSKKKAFVLLSVSSFVIAACLTILYQYSREVHLFDWIGSFIGAPVTYVFFGLAAGRLIKRFLKK